MRLVRSKKKAPNRFRAVRRFFDASRRDGA
jgi:hypothetical protein